VNWARWERFAPLTGIVAVVLWVVGVAVAFGPGNLVSTDSTPDEILSNFSEDATTLQIGLWLVQLGAVVFLWFVGSLRTVLRRAEGGVGRLASIATFGGVATGILVLLMHAPTYAGAATTKNLSPEAAQGLILMDDAFFYSAEFAIAVLFLATAIVIFRWGALPVWFGWVSLVFGILAPITPVGWAVLSVGLPLWTLAAAWLLFARSVAPEAAAPDAPPPVA
jgi:hypothetical protein